MERIVHDLVQGSPAWDEFRLTHFGASEIAAVLGLSKKTTRTELLRAKKTGIAKEFSDWLRDNVLDRGHQIEALARPLAVEFAGVDGFYPATYSLGRISGSTDGVDMPDEAAWECKTLNAQNGPIVRAGSVPEEHMPQCQQVLMVTGADRLLFTVSDGTRENTFHVWVEPDTAWFDRIRAAWAQFAIDLAAYVPAASEPPKPLAKTMESLPALLVSVKGEVTDSNLTAYKDHAFAVLAKINRDLKTDQDFATAKATVNWCADVETRIAAGKEHILGQTQSIDAVFRTMDEISAEARRIRLDLDRLVTRRELEVKTDMVMAAKAKYGEHIVGLQKETEGTWINLPAPDFAAVIKGKRSLALMQDALDTALANGKIAADASAKNIRANLACIAADGAGFEFLFSDRLALIAKPLDDLKMLIAARITEHKSKEATRLEAQRETIRQQEREKLEREQAAETKRQQDAAEAAARVTTQAAIAQAATPAPAPVAASAPIAAAPVVAVAPRPAEPEVDPGATVNIGQINACIAPLSIDARGLESLGFKTQPAKGAAKLYREADLPQMVEAMREHLARALEAQAA